MGGISGPNYLDALQALVAVQAWSHGGVLLYYKLITRPSVYPECNQHVSKVYPRNEHKFISKIFCESVDAISTLLDTESWG